MTATIGYSSLLIALALAGWGIVAPPLGARTGRHAFFASARGAILGQFAFVTLASLALIYALVTTDFSIKYVALHTTRATPIYYRVTGLWGALEGSLLLWEWVLIIFSGLLAVAGPIVALLALLGYGLTRNPREIPTPLLAKPAAPFTLALFDGHQLSLEDLRGARWSS